MDGRLSEASALFDNAIHLLLARWPRAADPDEAFTADGYLSQMFLYKGVVAYQQCDYVSAAGLFRRAVEQLEVLAAKAPRVAVLDLLSQTYKNLGTVLTRQGKTEEAVAYADRAVKLRRELAEEPAVLHPERDLADALGEKAGVLVDAGDAFGAADLLRQVVAIYERTVQNEGKQIETPRLAKAYVNLALVTSRSGDHRAALPLFDKGIALMDRCVRELGHSDLEPELIHFLLNSEVPLRELGRWSEARSCLHQVVSRLEPLIRDRGRDDLRNDLAMAYSDLAYVAVQQDNLSEARRYYRECIAIWRDFVHRQGRREFSRYLELAEANLQNV
jgi:tetratricopeptide (TPR) repeat protein